MSEEFILIGHPVAHSVSPAIHHRAYELLGKQACYTLVDCPTRQDVLAQVRALAAGKIRGANVTVPWKKVAYDAADAHHESALGVGVANVLTRAEDGRVIAYNTDAIALGSEIRDAMALSKLDFKDRAAALIYGGGGAALAAVVGCRLAGLKNIAVTARRFDPSLEENDWPGFTEFKRLGVKLLPWPTIEPGPANAHLSQTAIVVQASSAGMKGTGGGEELCDAIGWKSLPPAVAYDLVYNPPQTPFLKRAESEGHFCRGGLGMLVGQAAAALEIWWGERPSHEPLMVEAKKALKL